MSEKIIKGRDWAFIVYPESAPENWREILDETHMRWIESPFVKGGEFEKIHRNETRTRDRDELSR